MNQELALWIIGILLAVVGFLLVRVLKQGDDTNKKVTAQGESFARLETTVGHLTTDVRGLKEWRQVLTDRALEAAEERARELEAERRHGPPDRRGLV